MGKFFFLLTQQPSEQIQRVIHGMLEGCKISCLAMMTGFSTFPTKHEEFRFASFSSFSIISFKQKIYAEIVEMFLLVYPSSLLLIGIIHIHMSSP